MLINRSHCKSLALELAGRRPHKFSRVSAEYLDYVDGRVRQMMVQDIAALPSIGKTVYPPVRAGKEEVEE